MSYSYKLHLQSVISDLKRVIVALTEWLTAGRVASRSTLVYSTSCSVYSPGLKRAYTANSSCQAQGKVRGKHYLLIDRSITQWNG